MDDDDYGADDALLAAMAASDPVPPRPKQPTPQKIQQPTPQRLDKPPPAGSTGPKIVQPTPQALPSKNPSGSTILVSPRQRGNPILTSIRSMPWEYSDIPADFVLGLTTCALFLSLKYHRLHPEYIYTRIRNLQGKYDLRILLTMVDIPNHEDALRELSKTSVVNNVTIILCWSAAEAGRYLELYKSYENASFTSIRGQQASSYSDRLVEFVTVPRSLNKSDAVALVASFGSLKNAINAEQEQLSMISGWGGVKVKRWTAAIEEPFRAKKAAKRGLDSQASGRGDASRLEQAVPLSRVPLRDMPAKDSASSRVSPDKGAPSAVAKDAPKQFHFMDENDDDDDDDDDDDMDAEDALLAAAIEDSKKTSQQRGSEAVSGSAPAPDEDGLSGGVAAALARLRESG